jgi:hypothetical protein
MSRRSFLFGTLVLLAGLAAATPARAGSVITTTVNFATASPGLTEIDLTYSGVGTLSGLTPTTFTGGTATLTGDVVALKFTTPDTGPFAFTFTMQDSTSTPASLTPTFTPSNSSLSGFGFSISQGSVPEPATLALLGIGMTGLLAFRRFFKKTSVA